MSAQQTEFKETNSTPVATVKPELPDDNQKKQGLRRIFQRASSGRSGRGVAATRRCDRRWRALLDGIAWRGSRLTTHK